MEFRDGELVKPTIKKRRKVNPTYVVGEAYELELGAVKGLVIHLRFVKNLRNEVKGYVEVIDRDGRVLLRVKYVDGLIRRSCGDSQYFDYVEKMLNYLRIPYGRLNLRTGRENCASYTPIH